MIPRSRGTKAKIRNIMSGVCTPRYPLRLDENQSHPCCAAKRQARADPNAAYGRGTASAVRGTRASRSDSSVAGCADGNAPWRVAWPSSGRDIDFQKWTLNIRKSIWHQHLGPVKTEESEKTMPLDEEMIADLLRWRAGNALRPGRAIGSSPVHVWLVVSHSGPRPSCATTSLLLLGARASPSTSIGMSSATHSRPYWLKTDEDVKTVQSLMRHANSNITMDIYTHAVSSKKRRGSKQGGGDGSAAGQESPSGGVHRGYGLMCTFLCTTPFQQLLLSC